MENTSPFMAVLPNEEGLNTAHNIATALGYSFADIVIGTPVDAAMALSTRSSSPKFILVDIGNQQEQAIEQLDSMAEHCVAGTKVIVVGAANDINFYRELVQRGVLEYFTHPMNPTQVIDAFAAASAPGGTKGQGTIISLMSAASGDGSSTIAVNLAYALAQQSAAQVVLVDMDYQFGMIAKNLDVSSPYGIKEIFDHPDRGVDATLLERMQVDYKNHFKIIAAPYELKTFPVLRPELIRDMLAILQSRFDYVVLDLPHVWASWIAAASAASDFNVIVSQLWLRSVTHAARLTRAWREIGVAEEDIIAVINRSGAKFKEAITARDFERVCNTNIDAYLANDIRTVVTAENQGSTILEIGGTVLQQQLKDFADLLIEKSKSRKKMMKTI